MNSSSDPLYPLIERTAHGDREGFQLLYDRTGAKLFGVLQRILKDPGLSEEICQEVFVTIWQKAKLYNPDQGRVMSWMIAIARNRAIDTLRRSEEKVRQNTLGDLDSAGLASLPALQQNPPDMTAQLSLTRCLNEIDEERRQSVLLAYCYGWSREELANKYEVPLNTMKSWLRRALQQLKDCLERAS